MTTKTVVLSSSNFVIKVVWFLYIAVSNGILFSTGFSPPKPFFIGLFIFCLGLLCDYLSTLIASMVDNHNKQIAVSIIGLTICIISLIFTVLGLCDYVKISGNMVSLFKIQFSTFLIYLVLMLFPALAGIELSLSFSNVRRIISSFSG